MDTRRPVLITGINGFLGSTLARRLVSSGRKVIGIVKDQNFKTQRDILEKCSIVQGDVKDFATVMHAISHYECSEIFHLAAVTILRKSVTNPIGTYETNIMGTLNVLEAARQCEVEKTVCKSTDKSYGTYDVMPYIESMAVQASPDSYSTSKACMDLISQQYAQGYNMNVSIIRCGNAYGPADFNLSRLVPGSVIRVLNGERPVLHEGVKDYAREFMYSEDIVDAYLTVAEKGLPGEAYNIGGSGRVTVYEVVKKIMNKMGMDGEPTIKPFKYKEIKDQWLDSTKLRSLGWSHQHSIDQGLDKTIQWYKNHEANTIL